MADETNQDTEAAADKPLAELAVRENEISHDPQPADEPISAADRLRAFEDEKLGVDAPRYGGKVEQGVGSLFSRLSDADKEMHGKLENLVEAEAKLAAAHSALIAADAEHEAALAAVEAHDG